MQNVTSVSIECTFGCQNVNQARSGCPTSIASTATAPLVADEADDYRAVDHRLQLLLLQDVQQKAGKERARAQRDDVRSRKIQSPNANRLSMFV